MDSLVEFRSFLDDVRFRATGELTSYICQYDKEADPADVHEDVRETLYGFFAEIRHRIEGPPCEARVEIGLNAVSSCKWPQGHEGAHERW